MFAQESVMDIKELKAEFEKLKYIEEKLEYLNFDEHLDCYVEKSNGMPVGLAAWVNGAFYGFEQAAKAQAVPEGFVLVKRVHPDAIVHNQGLGLFKECQVIYGWDGKSKDFKDALNKGFYHGVKLGAKAVLETAMIEAQEPAND